MRVLAALLLAALALGGCSADEPAEGEEGRNVDGVAQDPGSRPVLTLDDCRGIRSEVTMSQDQAGLEPLPGWDRSNTGFTGVNVEPLLCAKLAIDRFERGPIGLVLEYYGAPGGPAECTAGRWDSVNLLHAVWISDAEVAQYLASLGLQVRLATVEVADEANAAVVTRRVPIVPVDSEAAVLEAPRPALDEGGVSSANRRYFFLNGVGGVSFLDFTIDAYQYSFEPPLTNGTLPEPFLYARSGSSELIGGHGNMFDDATVHSPLYQFKDLECLEPL